MQRRLVLCIEVAVLLAGGLLLPFASRPLAPAPAVAALFGAVVASAALLTFLLLANGNVARRTPAVVLLACAYLASGLFAILHLATFPGAILPDRAVIGSNDTVGWLFAVWQATFPALVLAAAIAHRPDALTVDKEPSKGGLRAAVIATVAFVALAAAVAFFAPLPAYFEATSFAPRGRTLTWLAAALCLAGIVVIARHGRSNHVLFLCVSLALLSEGLGNVLSNLGGGRFTVGWYALRLCDVMAATVVLALLLRQVVSTQASLRTTVAALEAQKQALHAEVQRRETAERKLVRAQRMEAVGQLAGGVGHDFNNVLHVIGTRSDLVKLRKPPREILEDIAVIKRSVERGQGLTRQLLSLSGRRALRPRVIVINEWLPPFLDVLRSFALQGIPLRAEIAPDVRPVNVDQGELETALINLVTNARDAMPDGGTVTIVARNARDATGDHVVIAVRDTGSGIDADIVDRVFEPFFTTKEVGKASGLGLSQVYGFATRSEGTVSIESTRGVGTVVIMRFPAAEVEAPEPVSITAVQPAPSNAGTVVLVVDDNEEIATATVALLQHLGYATHVAASGEEAADMLARGEVKPRVVLSDIVMPGGVSGIDLAQLIRQQFPGIAVVLSTGYSEAAQRALADRLTILEKPYEASTLERALVAAIAQSAPARAL